jgi:hypothetical protein
VPHVEQQGTGRPEGDRHHEQHDKALHASSYPHLLFFPNGPPLSPSFVAVYAMPKALGSTVRRGSGAGLTHPSTGIMGWSGPANGDGASGYSLDLRVPGSPLIGNAALSISIDRFVALTRHALTAEELKSTLLRCVLGPCLRNVGLPIKYLRRV